MSTQTDRSKGLSRFLKTQRSKYRYKKDEAKCFDFGQQIPDRVLHSTTELTEGGEFKAELKQRRTTETDMTFALSIENAPIATTKANMKVTHVWPSCRKVLGPLRAPAGKSVETLALWRRRRAKEKVALL